MSIFPPWLHLWFRYLLINIDILFGLHSFIYQSATPLRLSPSLPSSMFHTVYRVTLGVLARSLLIINLFSIVFVIRFFQSLWNSILNVMFFLIAKPRQFLSKFIDRITPSYFINRRNIATAKYHLMTATTYHSYRAAKVHLRTLECPIEKTIKKCMFSWCYDALRGTLNRLLMPIWIVGNIFSNFTNKDNSTTSTFAINKKSHPVIKISTSSMSTDCLEVPTPTIPLTPSASHLFEELLEEGCDRSLGERLCFLVRELQRCRDEDSQREMMYRLRTELTRDIGGLCSNSCLWDSPVSEVCIDEIVRSLRFLLIHPQISQGRKVAFFKDMRHSFGSSALLLSGGAQFGVYHFGICRALFERGLLCRIMSGSSAGSIVAALICVRNDAELRELFCNESAPYFGMDMRAFAGLQKGSVQRKMMRFLSQGVLMDVTVLQACIRDNVGDITFLEAFRRTGRILNITVTPTSKLHSNELPRILNYLTTPNVLIYSACATSCCVPGLFAPVQILQKDTNGLITPYMPFSGLTWMDGSIEHDIPMDRVAELFNVNSFIVSQCNPYVVPILRLVGSKTSRRDPKNSSKIAYASSLSSSPSSSWLLSGMRMLCYTTLSEFRHWYYQAIVLGIIPSRLACFRFLLRQPYEGDVTMLPEFCLSDYLMLLKNPSPSNFFDLTMRGQRLAWEQIPALQNRCKIEFALDECLRQLEGPLSWGLSSTAFSTTAWGGGSDGKRYMAAPTPLGLITPGSGAGGLAAVGLAWGSPRVPPSTASNPSVSDASPAAPEDEAPLAAIDLANSEDTLSLSYSFIESNEKIK